MLTTPFGAGRTETKRPLAGQISGPEEAARVYASASMPHQRGFAGQLTGIGLAAALAAGLHARPASACSCAPSPPPNVAFEHAGSVLLGEVVSVRHDPSQHQLTATVRVIDRWKGAAEDPVEVTTIDVGSMCGIALAKGDRYVFYATETASPISASLCSRTRLASAASEDLAFFESRSETRGAEPETPNEPTEGAPTPIEGPPPMEPPSPTLPAAPPAEPSKSGCAGCSLPQAPTGPWLAAAALVAAALRRRAKKQRRD